ncbi:MAG: hypoxanthine phosphoribosyltransferase [Synergistetes bacterium]|nr:hypoxanthine phosphoribosyltransferase [Synergistota bacterium]MCX8128051.1 hypoxanthine phosphoribosyltransferase [Synergistota bacterium]MDW8193089.1 hypoxanthine phosphoribosyltransferase [Synergistota bacterium]
MRHYVGEILISREDIQKRVKELAEVISKDYEGKDPVFVGVLKGAIMFMADLLRNIPFSVYVDFMAVSSYGNSTETSGIVKIDKDLDTDIKGRHVLIVEDIIDSGLTLQYLLGLLSSRIPASLKVCALLSKPARRKVEIPIAYLGFNIPSEFVVGYGLDFAGRYRNLPDIRILRFEDQ